MPNTVRTLDQLLLLFPDNTTKLISPQRQRDFVFSAFGFSYGRDPGATDDNMNTSAVGAFFDVWSKWRNNGTNALFVCVDGTPTAAVWVKIYPQGGGSPSGPAGGDLGSNYPNPLVASLLGVVLGGSTPNPGDVLTASGGTDADWAPGGGGGGGVMNGARVSGGTATLFATIWTDLVYSTTEYDTTTYFDGVSTFTVPTTGYYAMGGTMYFQGTGMSATWNYARLWVNGMTMVGSATLWTDPSQVDPFGFTSNNAPCCVMAQCHLTAGDTVQLQGWVEGPFNTNCYGGGNFWIQFLGT